MGIGATTATEQDLSFLPAPCLHLHQHPDQELTHTEFLESCLTVTQLLKPVALFTSQPVLSNPKAHQFTTVFVSHYAPDYFVEKGELLSPLF